MIKHDTGSMWAMSGIITMWRTNLYGDVARTVWYVQVYARPDLRVGVVLSPTDTDILNRLYMIDAAEYVV